MFSAFEKKGCQHLFKISAYNLVSSADLEFAVAYSTAAKYFNIQTPNWHTWDDDLEFKTEMAIRLCNEMTVRTFDGQSSLYLGRRKGMSYWPQLETFGIQWARRERKRRLAKLKQHKLDHVVALKKNVERMEAKVETQLNNQNEATRLDELDKAFDESSSDDDSDSDDSDADEDGKKEIKRKQKEEEEREKEKAMKAALAAKNEENKASADGYTRVDLSAAQKELDTATMGMSEEQKREYMKNKAETALQLYNFPSPKKKKVVTNPAGDEEFGNVKCTKRKIQLRFMRPGRRICAGSVKMGYKYFVSYDAWWFDQPDSASGGIYTVNIHEPTRYNHYQCPFSFRTHHLTPYWRLAVSCHQLQSLSFPLILYI